jgi:hypothetical protein
MGASGVTFSRIPSALAAVRDALITASKMSKDIIGDTGKECATLLIDLWKSKMANFSFDKMPDEVKVAYLVDPRNHSSNLL